MTPAPWRGVVFATPAAFLFARNGSVSKTVLASGLSSQRLVELRSAARRPLPGLGDRAR